MTRSVYDRRAASPVDQRRFRCDRLMRPRRSHRGQSRRPTAGLSIAGVLGVALASLADGVTTAVGLAVGLVEVNPIAASAMAMYGTLLTIAVLTTLAVVVVAVAAEALAAAATWLVIYGRGRRWWPAAVRASVYGYAMTVYGVAAASNAGLIAVRLPEVLW